MIDTAWEVLVVLCAVFGAFGICGMVVAGVGAVVAALRAGME